MTKHRKLILLAASVSALGAGEPAAAQVFIDPSSPSGKEYAIPLEDVRREAAPGADDGPIEQGDRSAPLFGEGIGDDTEAAGGSVKGDGANNGRGDGGASPQGAAGAQQSATERAIAGTRPLSASIPQGGIDSAATIGALALSILLLGGVIGSIARRRTG